MDDGASCREVRPRSSSASGRLARECILILLIAEQLRNASAEHAATGVQVEYGPGLGVWDDNANYWYPELAFRHVHDNDLIKSRRRQASQDQSHVLINSYVLVGPHGRKRPCLYVISGFEGAFGKSV